MLQNERGVHVRFIPMTARAEMSRRTAVFIASCIDCRLEERKAADHFLRLGEGPSTVDSLPLRRRTRAPSAVGRSPAVRIRRLSSVPVSSRHSFGRSLKAGGAADRRTSIRRVAALRFRRACSWNNRRGRAVAVTLVRRSRSRAAIRARAAGHVRGAGRHAKRVGRLRQRWSA